MNRTHPRPFIAVLMLAYVSFTGVAFAGAQPTNHGEPSPTPARPLTLLVEVENDARIPPTDLGDMEELVSRIYLAIGVRVIWVHGEVPPGDPRGLRVHMRLLSRTRADRKIARERIGTYVLGQANRPARVVDIFCDRIAEVSLKYLQEFTRVLGLVMAHEMGHVLLPASIHSVTGIMRDRVDLGSKTVHYFTAEQGAAIRSLLLSESQAGSETTRPANLKPEPNLNTNREARTPEA